MPFMPESTQKKYETGDLNPRAILWFVITLTILLLSAFLASAAVLRFWSNPRTTRAGGFSVGVQPTESAPGPRLQVAPAADLQKLRALEETNLSQYQWIDKQAGIAAIPIERAMQLMAERAAKGQSTGKPSPPAAKERR
jgi:hypothetical protein